MTRKTIGNIYIDFFTDCSQLYGTILATYDHSEVAFILYEDGNIEFDTENRKFLELTLDELEILCREAIYFRDEHCVGRSVKR
jgi:hypothetical protein